MQSIDSLFSTTELQRTDQIVEGVIQLAWLDGLSEDENSRQMRVPRRQISSLLENQNAHVLGDTNPDLGFGEILDA